MSFPAYPDYKDSGVPWLGSIPTHWAVSRIKDLFEIRKRIAGELGHDVLSITQSGLRVKDVESNDGQQAMDYSKYQRVQLGDFAMNHMDLLTGWIDIASQSGVTSPDYRVFALRDPSVINDRFYLSVFQMAYTARQFYPFGQGSSQLGRWRLPTDAFNAFPIPLPPKAEQDRICSFLERETAKIDALVAEQHRLIKLLKEKRQSVISHAVAKGLNADAPTKDSGIEWLGQIPSHWEIGRLGYFTRQIVDGAHFTPTYVDEGVPFLRVTDITGSGIDMDRLKRIPQSEHDELIKRCQPSKGDLLLSKNGTVGVPAVVNWDWDFSIFVSLCLIKFDVRIDVNFAKLVFLSKYIEMQINAGAKQSTVNNLHLEKIRSFVFPVPSIAEQKEIVVALTTETDSFDRLINASESAISLMQERRAALISAAVTGKIDVRALVHKDNVVPIGCASASKALTPLSSIVGAYAIVHFGKLGRMAVMKAGFLAEAHSGLHELNGRYERNAAGPYDSALIVAMERGATELCGITTTEPLQQTQRVTYTVPRNLALPSAELTEAVGPERARAFENMLALLNGISREGVEAIATIYAVWNDLMAAAKPADDDAIATGVLNDWHTEKAAKFKQDDVTHWLAWMRRNGMVPNGNAPRTDHQGSLFA